MLSAFSPFALDEQVGLGGGADIAVDPLSEKVGRYLLAVPATLLNVSSATVKMPPVPQALS